MATDGGMLRPLATAVGGPMVAHTGQPDGLTRAAQQLMSMGHVRYASHETTYSGQSGITFAGMGVPFTDMMSTPIGNGAQTMVSDTIQDLTTKSGKLAWPMLLPPAMTVASSGVFHTFEMRTTYARKVSEMGIFPMISAERNERYWSMDRIGLSALISSDALQQPDGGANLFRVYIVAIAYCISATIMLMVVIAIIQAALEYQRRADSKRVLFDLGAGSQFTHQLGRYMYDDIATFGAFNNKEEFAVPEKVVGCIADKMKRRNGVGANLLVVPEGFAAMWAYREETMYYKMGPRGIDMLVQGPEGVRRINGMDVVEVVTLADGDGDSASVLRRVAHVGIYNLVGMGSNSGDSTSYADWNARYMNTQVEDYTEAQTKEIRWVDALKASGQFSNDPRLGYPLSDVVTDICNALNSGREDEHTASYRNTLFVYKQDTGATGRMWHVASFIGQTAPEHLDNITLKSVARSAAAALRRRVQSNASFAVDDRYTRAIEVCRVLDSAGYNARFAHAILVEPGNVRRNFAAHDGEMRFTGTMTPEDIAAHHGVAPLREWAAAESGALELPTDVDERDNVTNPGPLYLSYHGFREIVSHGTQRGYDADIVQRCRDALDLVASVTTYVTRAFYGNPLLDARNCPPWIHRPSIEFMVFQLMLRLNVPVFAAINRDDYDDDALRALVGADTVLRRENELQQRRGAQGGAGRYRNPGDRRLAAETGAASQSRRDRITLLTGINIDRTAAQYAPYTDAVHHQPFSPFVQALMLYEAADIIVGALAASDDPHAPAPLAASVMTTYVSALQAIITSAVQHCVAALVQASILSDAAATVFDAFRAGRSGLNVGTEDERNDLAARGAQVAEFAQHLVRGTAAVTDDAVATFVVRPLIAHVYATVLAIIVRNVTGEEFVRDVFTRGSLGKNFGQLMAEAQVQMRDHSLDTFKNMLSVVLPRDRVIEPLVAALETGSTCYRVAKDVINVFPENNPTGNIAFLFVAIARDEAEGGLRPDAYPGPPPGGVALTKNSVTLPLASALYASAADEYAPRITASNVLQFIFHPTEWPIRGNRFGTFNDLEEILRRRAYRRGGRARDREEEPGGGEEEGRGGEEEPGDGGEERGGDIGVEEGEHGANVPPAARAAPRVARDRGVPGGLGAAYLTPAAEEAVAEIAQRPDPVDRDAAFRDFADLYEVARRVFPAEADERRAAPRARPLGAARATPVDGGRARRERERAEDLQLARELVAAAQNEYDAAIAARDQRAVAARDATTAAADANAPNREELQNIAEAARRDHQAAILTAVEADGRVRAALAEARRIQGLAARDVQLDNRARAPTFRGNARPLRSAAEFNPVAAADERVEYYRAPLSATRAFVTSMLSYVSSRDADERVYLPIVPADALSSYTLPIGFQTPADEHAHMAAEDEAALNPAFNVRAWGTEPVRSAAGGGSVSVSAAAASTDTNGGVCIATQRDTLRAALTACARTMDETGRQPAASVPGSRWLSSSARDAPLASRERAPANVWDAAYDPVAEHAAKRAMTSSARSEGVAPLVSGERVSHASLDALSATVGHTVDYIAVSRSAGAQSPLDTHAFRERWVAMSTGFSGQLERVMALLYLLTPVCAAAFIHMIENDVMPGFGFVMTRNQVALGTQSILALRAGYELGATLMHPPIAQLGTDANTQSAVFTHSHKVGPVVINPRNAFLAADVAVTSYRGGGGTTWITSKQALDPYGNEHNGMRAQGGDARSMMVPLQTLHNMPDPFDISGVMPGVAVVRALDLNPPYVDKYGEQLTDQGIEEFGRCNLPNMAFFLITYFGLSFAQLVAMHVYHDLTGATFVDSARAAAAPPGQNTLCFRGWCGAVSPYTPSTASVLATGHLRNLPLHRLPRGIKF